MVSATYDLYIDSGRDDQFATNITSYLMEFDIKLGMDKPYSHMANITTAEFKVDNSGQKFSPAHANVLSGYGVGCPIRFRMTYSTTEIHFVGWVVEPEIDPFNTGEQLATINCEGLLRRYKESPAYIELQNSIHVDEAVKLLIQAAKIRPPGYPGWVLGHPYYSRLGETTKLSSVDNYTIIDDGNSRSLWLTQYGVDLPDNLYDALAELAEADRGYFWMNREGIAEYWPRTKIVNNLTAAVDLAEPDIQMSTDPVYQWIPTKVNRVTLRITAKELGTSQTVVGSSDRDIKFSPGDTVNITIPFEIDGEKIGAYEVQNINATYDFTATATHTWKNKTVSFDLGDLVIPTSTIYADRIEISFDCTSSAIPTNYSNYLIQNLQVRGKPIYIRKNEDIAYQDDTDIATSNVFPFNEVSKLITDADFAQEWAIDLVNSRKDDRGLFLEVTISANRDATLMAFVRDINVSNRVSITDTEQTGEDTTEYYIIGYHEWSENSMSVHYVTLYLEPVPPQRWVLGDANYSKLGVTTTLALTDGA